MPTLVCAGLAECIAGAKGDHVRMGSIGDEPTGAAHTAGVLCGSGQVFAEETPVLSLRPVRIAIQQTCVLQGKGRPTGRFGPGKQQRVGWIVCHREGAQLTNKSLVSDDRFHRSRVPDTVASSAPDRWTLISPQHWRSHPTHIPSSTCSEPASSPEVVGHAASKANHGRHHRQESPVAVEAGHVIEIRSEDARNHDGRKG